MLFNFNCFIRGDGKAYVYFCPTANQAKLLNSLPKISQNLRLDVSTLDGSTIDGCIVAIEESGTGANYFACVFPLLNIPLVLSLKYCDPHTNICHELANKVVKPFFLKWKSRLNYRLHPRRANLLRNVDILQSKSNFRILINQVIPDDNALITRGTILSPTPFILSDTLKVYNANLKEVEICPSIMGTLGIKEGYGEQFDYEQHFSVRLKAGEEYILFASSNSGFPQPAFIALDLNLIPALIGNYFKETASCTTQSSYEHWLIKNSPSEHILNLQKEASFKYKPKFSIVVPVYKTPVPYFLEMVNSVKSQTYSNWELILVNASSEDVISEYIDKEAKDNPRIKVVSLINNEGITLNTLEGIKVASGDYVGFFDHDDLLMPDALFEYALALNEDSSIDVLYCDEDKFDGSRHYDPYFKPDFSLFLVREINYVCHFMVVRRSLLNTLVLDNPIYDGAQDHNVILQCAEKTDRIKHVPKILYSWRAHQGSTALQTGEKPYADIASYRAKEDHLSRCKIEAEVLPSIDMCRHNIKYKPSGNPLVSIIIPSRDNAVILDRCIKSILDKTLYNNFEIIIIENNSNDPDTFEEYEKLINLDSRIHLIVWEKEFNFASICNYGVEHSNGEYLLFLNNDTEVLQADWINNLLGICQQPDVGIVGCKLLYPDMLVQHAGVQVQETGPQHISHNLTRNARGYCHTACTTHELSAVTAACMMVKRDVFDEVKGFNSDFAVAFNDVDFCLKVRDIDYLVIFTPLVELIHYESISRGYDHDSVGAVRFFKELSLLRYLWPCYFLKGDPYLNKNLNPDNAYYALPEDDD